MNRLAKHTFVRVTALAAAMAFGLAPASLLAHCACDLCGCSAATGDATDCCCTGTAIQAAGCCPAEQQACAFGSSGCSCEVGVPAPPAAVSVAANEARSKDSRGTPVEATALPYFAANHTSSERASLRLAAQDRALDSAVPFRVLFCVWRN